MSKSGDDILAEELGKIGELGGKLAACSQTGPRKGRLLDQEVHLAKTCCEVPSNRNPYGEAFPEYPTGEGANKPPYPLLKAVVSSGFLNMNPAVVYLEILDEDSNADGKKEQKVC